ncbi:MAG: replicative DNA helicase [Bacteroidaceae bacterium]|nr:replicative DNA helicase [Bacteroidaceae bacterium]
MPSKTNSRTAAPDQLLTHMPPQALEMERSVLGSLMVDRAGYDIVTDILSPDSFYDKKHQLIYAAIRDLAAEDKPFDAISVKAQLEKNGTFNDAGQMVYLADLVREATGSAGIRYHAEVIAEKYIKRQLITASSEMQTQAFDETIDSQELLNSAQQSLYRISQDSQHKDFTQINPVVDRVYKSIEDAAKLKGGLSGVPTLFHKIDDITSGWQNSDLIIIAARPAMGKTAFALSMARNIAVSQRLPMAFFSLEMSNDQLVKRLVSNVCEIAADKLRSGDLKPYEWTQLDSKITELKDAPLFIDDTSSLSIFELRTKARRLVAEHGVKIIMIDYLQLMTASGSGIKFGNRQEEVSTISRNLKALAKELDVPIIALSQVNREVAKREGEEAKRPQLSDLRESGAIEQDADIVCFLHRPEYYKIYQSNDNTQDYRGKAEFIIAKHRNGALDIVQLKFKPEFTRFMNLDDYSVSHGGGSLRKQGGAPSAPSGDLPPEFGGGAMPLQDAPDPLGGNLDAKVPF